MTYEERLYRAAEFLLETGRVIPVDLLARLEALGYDISQFV